MKKNKFLIIALIVVFCTVGLTGCKNSDVEEDEYDLTKDINISSKKSENDVKKILNDSQIPDNPDESGDVSSKIAMSSTEDRAVFNFGNAYYIIFDFSGDDVINYSYCYMYDTEEAGEQAYNQYIDELKDSANSSLSGLENVAEVKREGKYVTIVMKESVCEDMTKTEVMETYKYLEQIYEN